MTRSGIIRDMPAHEYHAGPEVSSSHLRRVAKYGAAAADVMRRQQQDTSPAMRLGTLVHTLVLEPERLGEEIAVWPDAVTSTRTKAYRDWIASLPAHVLAVSPDEMQRAEAIRDAVLAHDSIASLLSWSEREVSIFWTDAETGIALRARLDIWDDVGGTAADLKTTSETRELEAWHGLVSDRSHPALAHVQAALYVDAATLAGLRPRDAYSWAVVSTVPPHTTWRFDVNHEVLAAGRRVYRSALRDWAAYLDAGGAGAYRPGGIITPELPGWAAGAQR